MNEEFSVSQIPPEEAITMRAAVPSRRREFAAGRACARAALARLGFAPDQVIPRAKDRLPVWPEGVVGSISHCTGFCGAVVARKREIRAIGFDAEVLGRMEEAGPATRALVSSPVEDKGLPGTTDSFDPLDVLFSGKESFYKAYYPENKCFLDFLDVVFEIDVERSEFQVRLLRGDVPRFFGVDFARGRFVVQDGIVLTSVVREV